MHQSGKALTNRLAVEDIEFALVSPGIFAIFEQTEPEVIQSHRTL